MTFVDDDEVFINSTYDRSYVKKAAKKRIETTVPDCQNHNSLKIQKENLGFDLWSLTRDARRLMMGRVTS